jgi:hypothetical protein
MLPWQNPGAQIHGLVTFKIKILIKELLQPVSIICCIAGEGLFKRTKKRKNKKQNQVFPKRHLADKKKIVPD